MVNNMGTEVGYPNILTIIRDMFAGMAGRSALSIIIFVGASQLVVWSAYWGGLSSTPPTFNTLVGQFVVVFLVLSLAFWIKKRYPVNVSAPPVPEKSSKPIDNPFRCSTAGDSHCSSLVFKPIGLVKQIERELLEPRVPPSLLVKYQGIDIARLLAVLSERMTGYFKIVVQNINDEPIYSVPGWMENLRMRTALMLQRHDGDWAAPSDWLSAWQEFSAWLEMVSGDEEHPLIMALNDIESLHIFLATDPEKGARLLAAIRSFSQHQNRMLFIFVSNDGLSKLTNPSWSQCFVHFQPVYLSSIDGDNQ